MTGETQHIKFRPWMTAGNGSMQTITRQQNKLVFSALSEFYAPVDATGFSIKYVVEGTEVYHLNNEQYVVGPGSYILSNSYKQGNVEIESNNTVKGICVSIAPEMIVEAVAGYCRPDTFFPDPELGHFFTTPDFPEDMYQAADTFLGKTLTSLASSIEREALDPADLNMELFYVLAERLIEDQLPVYRQLQAIPSVKSATKKAIYKNVNRGKKFIDSSYTLPLSIKDIAKEACMSEYHFFRLFRNITGTTPHQYILQKRLQKAKELLKHQIPVSDVAVSCGFSDIYSFSKAFKKYYQISPSALFKK